HHVVFILTIGSGGNALFFFRLASRIIASLCSRSFSRGLILNLIAQPLVSISACKPSEQPPSLQSSSMQDHSQYSLIPIPEDDFVTFSGYRLIPSLIPDFHFSCTIIPFGNGALKLSVRKRMVFHPDGKPFFSNLRWRSFRHRPTLQHTFCLQSEIIMQASSLMSLYNKLRSEERRVGKECRSGWWRSQWKREQDSGGSSAY